jgi:hypothetical protein
MRSRLPWLPLVLGVAACASVQSIDTSFESLKGRPLAMVLAKLGPPASQQASANGTATVWTDRVQDDTPVPTQRMTFENGRATTVEVMARPEPPIFRTCTLSVQSDAAGIVVAVDRNGTSAACAPMARKAAG